MEEKLVRRGDQVMWQARIAIVPPNGTQRLSWLSIGHSEAKGICFWLFQ
jgi:hypothetical protein